MKKWFKFFGTGFFSHRAATEAARRGYTNVFLGFVLALIFLWGGFVGADMLPFGAQYHASPDFVATAHAVLADADRRIDAEIQDGTLVAVGTDGEYTAGLLVNTLENEADKQKYSSGGYNLVVDLRPASTPAEVVAYCLSSPFVVVNVSNWFLPRFSSLNFFGNEGLRADKLSRLSIRKPHNPMIAALFIQHTCPL